MKYIIYFRVSTEKQDLRTQEEKCLEFLRKKHGSSEFTYELYSDKMSSRIPYDKRIGLQSAFKSLTSKDVFVATKLDRLARNSYEHYSIFNHLRNTIKVKDIILIDDQDVLDSKLLFAVKAAVAEEEVSMIRKRIKDKLHAKKERGERIGSTIPYGYALGADGIHLVEDSNEQEGLECMMKWHYDGVSYREIVKMMNEHGYFSRRTLSGAGIHGIIKKRKDSATFQDQLLA